MLQELEGLRICEMSLEGFTGGGLLKLLKRNVSRFP